MARTIVRLYDDFATAQRVAQELIDAGLDRDKISIMANDASGEYGNRLSTDTEVGEADIGGASTGAGIGAILGGGVGLLVGLGALAIPGIGPVIAAGPVLSALASAGVGAGIGAVTGGLVGALVDLGVPEEEAELYAEGVRRGGAILTVHADDELENQAMNIINRSQAVNVEERSKWWRERGWSSFDPNASPYTAGDVAQERASYEAYSRTTPNQGSRGWTEVEPDPEGTTYRGDVTDNPGYKSEGWTEVEPAPEGTTYRGDVTDNPGYKSEGWTEVEPAPEGTTYRGDVTDNPGYQSRGWTEVESDKQNDFDTQYGPRFREHFDTAYASQGYTYDTYAPAYRYGYDLASNPAYENRDWPEFEPEARRNWESNYQGGWEQFKDAVRHAWEETKEALGFEDDNDTYRNRDRSTR